jgi:hypothetical protein
VSAHSTALRGRAMAARLMTSTMQFFTPGKPVTDPNTGRVTRPQGVVWVGPCRIRPAGTQASTAEAGGAEVFAYDYIVSIPFEVTTVVEHMRGTVTDSPDPALAGITVEVQKVDRGDHITARRLSCTEVV